MRSSVRREALRVTKARGNRRGRLHVAPVTEPVQEAPRGKIGHNRPPTDAELDAFPISPIYAEYDLSAKEIERFRRRLYARNKTGEYLFRTTRFGGLLAVVRFM